MNLTSVIIKSKKYTVYNKKICGLYPLERNIRLCWQLGAKQIYLNLFPEELQLYNEKIKPATSKLDGLFISTDLIEETDDTDSLFDQHLEIESNVFMQMHYFANEDKYFKKTGKKIIPIVKSDQFQLFSEYDFDNAERIAINHIRLSAGGFIARSINKRISIPISKRLAPTGIHPNYLTVINFVLGIIGGSLLFVNTYWSIMIGCILMQVVSIFDGCDGEVAKMTLKFSKFGSTFDTVSDYTAVLIYGLGIAYLYFYYAPTMLLKLIVIVPGLGGIALAVYACGKYIVRYSNSSSFNAYMKEFLQKIPVKDYMVTFLIKMVFLTRKEFYSLLICLVGLTGKIFLIAPFYAIVCLITGVFLNIINYKYFKLLPFNEKDEMIYVSKRKDS